MNTKKPLKDLTIRNNFMFAAVMLTSSNCKDFLEMLLEISIERVEVNSEECIIYNPEFKGIRLDVYAKDEQNVCYNIEMQVATECLGKRTRYYHSQIDMELLTRGHSYEELPRAYVIFICDFDPFGEGKYRYTFETRCLENLNRSLEDESVSIFLSTRGRNPKEVSPELVSFLQFVREDSPDVRKDYGSALIRQLQDSMETVKKSREMGRRYMLLKDMLREEKKAGIAKGISDSIMLLLENFGPLPEELKSHIQSQTDPDVLKKMLQAAAESKSLEQFQEEVSNL